MDWIGSTEYRNWINVELVRAKSLSKSKFEYIRMEANMRVESLEKAEMMLLEFLKIQESTSKPT